MTETKAPYDIPPARQCSDTCCTHPPHEWTLDGKGYRCAGLAKNDEHYFPASGGSRAAEPMFPEGIPLVDFARPGYEPIMSDTRDLGIAPSRYAADGVGYPCGCEFRTMDVQRLATQVHLSASPESPSMALRWRPCVAHRRVDRESVDDDARDEETLREVIEVSRWRNWPVLAMAAESALRELHEARERRRIRELERDHGVSANRTWRAE